VNIWLTAIGFGSVLRKAAREQAKVTSTELQSATATTTTGNYRTEQGDPSPTDGADS